MKEFQEHLVFKVKRESLRMIQSNDRVTEATETERDTVSRSFYLLVLLLNKL